VRREADALAGSVPEAAPRPRGAARWLAPGVDLTMIAADGDRSPSHAPHCRIVKLQRKVIVGRIATAAARSG
jgi:hypothetical protein